MRTAISGLMAVGACLGVVSAVEAQVVNRSAPAVAQPPSAIQPYGTARLAEATGLPRNRPEDEPAIRSIAVAYTQAYNGGDAHALASLFTADAEMIDEDGEHLRGRPMIEEVFTTMFKERPGATIAIAPATLRFLGPDVAQEEGQTRVKLAGGEPPIARHYTVLFVKEGNRWMYSSVREEQEKNVAHHDRLQELQWLVGDWRDESPDSVVDATCRWTEDQNFLLRDFTVRVRGKSVMTVSERIGWDPSARQIKSWVFDSEGGHGTGLWSRDGNEWMIKSTGVLPDGRTATATHVLTRVGTQSARWSSIERTVGGEVVPDHAEYVMVRKPPPPRSH